MIVLSEQSCINTTISAPDSNEINLLCLNDKSCQHLDINGKFSNVINIVCSSNDTDLQICNNTNIIATNISNEFNLECEGYNACKNIYIIRALYSGDIYATDANYVNILSYANDFIWCVNELDCAFNLYLPSNDNDNNIITCQGYGCYNLNIYSENGLNDYIFKLNGCGICTQQYFCYSNWNIFCGKNYDNKLTVWNANYCYDNICGCTQNMENILSNSWDTYNSLTCESHNNYNFTCIYDKNGYCIINCINTQCRNKIINATNIKSSIIINCGGNNDDLNNNYNEENEGLCKNSKIYCPLNSNTECIINCIEDDSCVNIKIYSNSININKLWLNCSDYGSCEFTKIIAPKLKQIDIFCDNTDACYGLNVDATYAENDGCLV